jgi:hypothetical protein
MRTSKKNFQIVEIPRIVQNFSLEKLPPTTNEIIAMSRAFNHKMCCSEYDVQKIKWTKTIGEIIKERKLIKFREPTWVHLRFFVDNRMDRDNLRGCAKMLLDAMAEAELIVDDSPRWLKDITYKEEKPIKGVAIKLIVSVSNQQMYEQVLIKY